MILLAYLALGLFSGFCAGLFGVGGGAVIVPILTSLFVAQAFPHQHLLHLALGSSMATIMFTSVSSLRAHHQQDAVLWTVVARIAPGILIGGLLGSQLASHLPTRPLGLVFAIFMCCVAVQMLADLKPQPQRELPGALGTASVGVVIGGVSSLVAIGGGTLSVPFMTWCNVKLQQAIGHLGGDRIAYCGFRHLGLCDFRMEPERVARRKYWLYPSARRGGHGAWQCGGCAIRCAPYPQPASANVETNVRRAGVVTRGENVAYAVLLNSFY